MPSPLILRRLTSFVLLLTSPFALADQTGPYALLQQGRVEEATARLHDVLVSQPGDAQALQLLCRTYYSQDLADQAIQQCELAVASDPASSDDQMWLARAYGMKAQRVNPLTAFSYARKVRASFERAVQLDPNNAQAMSDLGEYYIAAPALIGGGTDRAQALAAKMLPLFPAQAHRLLAMSAEKNGDQVAAEREFLKVVAVNHNPAAYIDLGHFYKRRQEPEKMLSALQSGVDADHRHDASLVDAASILTAAHSSPEMAESLLRSYLQSAAKSDDAPAFKVHVQLGDLLQSHGDQAGAHREYAAAFSMAPDYAPARKAFQGSQGS